MLKMQSHGGRRRASGGAAKEPMRPIRNTPSRWYPRTPKTPVLRQALAGCKKAEEGTNGAVECSISCPGEHGGGDEEAQIVADLITKKHRHLACRRANAAAIRRRVQGATRQ